PKRSALRAPQGCAPGKANDPDKSRTGKGATSNEVRKGTFLKRFDSLPSFHCCASMIMSPFVLDRNVPLIGPPRGGQIGADGDEQEGVGKSRSAGASAQQAVAGGGCGAADARELPTGETPMEAVSGGRGSRSEAPQRGASLESSSRREVSAAGVAACTREVRWGGG